MCGNRINNREESEMAYKIEDIDWSKMPEGAVEFMLEDQNDYLTWIMANGESMYRSDVLCDWEIRTKWCEYDHRTRYKVSDHHPEQGNVWCGEGLPPIGTVCEARIDDNDGLMTVEIIAHAQNRAAPVAVYKYYTEDMNILKVGFKISGCFRPIKSNKDKFVEQLREYYQGLKWIAPSPEEAGVIYDATVSGELEVGK